MHKFILTVLILMLSCLNVFAAKVPDEVKDYILEKVPQATIRFDGVIIFPDNTLYLPLFPSLFSDVNSIDIKTTYPSNKTLSQKPDVIIFNNDFVLMKVLFDSEGHRTVLHMQYPPLQVRTGLLPQDMLVPSGLIIPENIKGIIGNLKIDTKGEDIIRVENKDSYESFLAESEPEIHQALLPQLKNKTVFITTNYSKNIQILNPPNAAPSYSLAQKSIPIDIKAVNKGRFILVTSYERPFIDIVSVSDSRFIKQINLPSNPEEILITEDGKKAYVTSPSASTIYVVNLETMSLTQKIMINGYCEKLTLNDGKLFYVDKLKNELWAIDIDKNYELKDIGRFPNVSALAFCNNKLYVASRTKSRVAVIDYDTLGLVSEFTTVNKPMSMILQGSSLYILGAQNNVIQKVNTENDTIVENIELNTGGFSTGFKRIDSSDLAVVTDLKNNYYTIFDLNKGKILKSYSTNVPIRNVIISDKVQLFE